MEADTFRDMLGSVSYAMYKDEVKYFLCGTYFELTTTQTRFVGTDGRRMAIAISDSVMRAEDMPWRKEHAIVPSNAVKVLEKVFKKTAENYVKFGIWNDGYDKIAFTDGVDWVYSRLVDGEYPKFDAIIPEPVGKRVVGNVSVLLDAVKQMMLVPYSSSAANKKETTVWAKIEPGRVEFSATNKKTKDISSITVAVDCDFSMEVGFEGKFMADVLGSVKSDNVWLDFTESDKGIVIKPDGGVGKLDLVMSKRKD